MGSRGPGAAKYYVMPGHKLYDELVHGVEDPTPYELDVIRRRWKQRGAPEAIMRDWSEPGRRPWAFWRFDVSKKDLADVEQLSAEAEKIVALGLAEEEGAGGDHRLEHCRKTERRRSLVSCSISRRSSGGRKEIRLGQKLK
jgi:hypothetical protein